MQTWLELAKRLEGQAAEEIAAELQRAYCDGLQDGVSVNPWMMRDRPSATSN